MSETSEEHEKRWNANHDKYLAHCHRRFKHGDTTGLFEAISWCIHFNLPVPRWAAEAFDAGLSKIHKLEAGSWDEAFGAPFPKGHRKPDAKRRRDLRWEVFQRVSALHRVGGVGISEDLFAEVASELHIGTRLCKEIWYKDLRAITVSKP